MLKTLEDSTRNHFERMLAGHRWMYAARNAGQQHGLALIVVGRRQRIKVPFDQCCSSDLAIMGAYADELNDERNSPATHLQSIRLVPA